MRELPFNLQLSILKLKIVIDPTTDALTARDSVVNCLPVLGDITWVK